MVCIEMAYATRVILAAILICNFAQLLLLLEPSISAPSGAGLVTIAVKEATSLWHQREAPTLFVEIEHKGRFYRTDVVEERKNTARFNSTFSFDAAYHDTIIVRVKDASTDNSSRGSVLVSPASARLGQEFPYLVDKDTRVILKIDWIKA